MPSPTWLRAVLDWVRTVPDDLFGPTPLHWSQLLPTVAVPSRKKAQPRVRAAPVMRQSSTWTDEQRAAHRRRQAEEYYAWALEELPRWKGRLSDVEWERLRQHVESLKP